MIKNIYASHKEPTNNAGYNELGMCMIPTTKRVEYIMRTEKVWKLMARNTGLVFVLDEADWLRIRDIHWFEWKGQVVTRQGQSLEAYLGIAGVRKHGSIPFDYRRQNYV